MYNYTDMQRILLSGLMEAIETKNLIGVPATHNETGEEQLFLGPVINDTDFVPIAILVRPEDKIISDYTFSNGTIVFDEEIEDTAEQHDEHLCTCQDCVASKYECGCEECNAWIQMYEESENEDFGLTDDQSDDSIEEDATETTGKNLWQRLTGWFSLCNLKKLFMSNSNTD